MDITKIVVNGIEIRVKKINNDDYLSITDIAKGFGSDDIVRNWLRVRNTIKFLGIWEELNNKEFNSVEFDGIKNKAGTNRFSISVKQWV